jgi:transcriptional regulator with XRE-family HTH domain
VDDKRVGEIIRAVRRRARLTQAALAARAGTSQPVVSDLERGHFEEVGLPLARRVCAALDVRLPLAPQWRGGDLFHLLDATHAALVEATISRLAAIGWQCAPEYTFSHFGERGSVDIVAWHAGAAALLVVEVKSRLVDLQDLFASMNRKGRLVPLLVAREQAWHACAIGLMLVVPASTTTYGLVRRHAALFRAALPARSRAVWDWLCRPSGSLRGVWFLPNIAGSDERRHRTAPRIRARSSVKAATTRPG